MKKFVEIKKLLVQHQQRIKDAHGVKRLGIFGSVVRNEASELSDIDTLVELNKPIGLDFVLLCDELEQVLGVQVNLVTPNALNTKMLNYILCLAEIGNCCSKILWKASIGFRTTLLTCRLTTSQQILL